VGRGWAVKLNIVQRFTLLSIVATVVVTVLLSGLVSNVLVHWLLQNEGKITAEAIRTITSIDLPSRAFGNAVRRQDDLLFDYIWHHIQALPETFRVKFYDVDGRIVWSDEPQLIGKTYEDNEELAEALLGSVEVEIGEPKSEHEFEKPLVPEGELLEIYVPLTSGETGTVYAVVEVYKHPESFLRSKRELTGTVWRGSVGGGLILFLSLFGLFRGALREQIRLERIERRYAEIGVELRVAGEIQRRLLPRELPEVPGVNVAVWHVPCREIGGDYYDVFTTHDGDLVLAVADSEGKGIPGALVMVETRQLLRVRADADAGVADTVRAVNETLAGATGPARIVTMFVSKLNPRSRTLTYCNAGHCPALLLRDGQVTRLDVGGIPAGVMTPVAYESGEVRLADDDVVLLHTDGVTEAFNAKGDLFGTERLVGILHRAGDDDTAVSIIERINAAVAEFAAGEPATDDTTLVCLKMTAADTAPA